MNVDVNYSGQYRVKHIVLQHNEDNNNSQDDIALICCTRMQANKYFHKISCIPCTNIHKQILEILIATKQEDIFHIL